MTPRLLVFISLLAASAGCTTIGTNDRAQYLRGWDAGFAQRPNPAA